MALWDLGYRGQSLAHVSNGRYCYEMNTKNYTFSENMNYKEKEKENLLG